MTKGPVLEVKLVNGQKTFVHKYGVATTGPLMAHNAPPGAEDLYLEFYCFKTGRTVDQGGLGRYGHFRKIAAILLPDLEWNPWLEWQISRLCDDDYARKVGDITQRYVCWAGCATAGKTFAAALFAFIWFLADPKNSIVILTSTSALMVRKRIWPVLIRLYVAVRDRLGQCGHMVDSKTTIQESRGNDLNAIFAKAVGEGETAKAAANIQGMHADRIFVLLDEATDVQDAILIAVENLKKNCREYYELRSGNARGRLDPLGQAMEPKDGWNSVNVEDEEWLTKTGVCLHFDGFKSPNVKAGKTIYKHIYSFETYMLALQHGNPNEISFWMYDRGFPPPDGINDTVFSEPMVDQYEGRGKFTFLSRRRTIAGLDPAFGGDKCVLRFAHYGDIDGDKMGIELSDRIEIAGEATSKHPLDYQIAVRTVEECKKRGMRQEELGVDSTGIGQGVYALINELWGPEVVSVKFGGDASEMPASASLNKPGKEVYANRVTELWYECRKFLEAGQLRGLTPEVIRDFCTRKYDEKLRRKQLETKEKCKKRIGHSPDDGDSVSIIIEVARRLGATAQTRGHVRDAAAWERMAQKLDSVNWQAEEETQPLEIYGWMQ